MRLIIFILLIALAFSFNARALGVASDYLENSTLILMEGTSKLYGIRLQNPGLEEIYIKLTYNEDIAKIVDYEEIYKIPPKSSKSVFFNISSQNSKQGTYTVGYTVHQLSGSSSGVPILLKINKNFNVNIIENPENKITKDAVIRNTGSYLAYVAVALALLLYIFGKKVFKYRNRKINKRKHQ